jgi:hypothetical protein
MATPSPLAASRAAIRAKAAGSHAERTTTSSVAWLVVGILLAVFVTPLAAGRSLPVPLATRARGAERIVLARVASVTPAWRQNEFGDRLIVSLARLVVDETLKGHADAELVVEVEGGTIGDLTLRVSDLAPITPGDRGVFYLHRNRAGTLVPHLRGQGILNLDNSDRVPGSGLTLDEIRRTVAQAEAVR